MKPGNNLSLIFFFSLSFFYYTPLFGEDTISSSTLVNIEKIKPSFEDPKDEVEILIPSQTLKVKLKKKKEKKLYKATMIGLDKITAKSTKLSIKFNETKKFGPLEIKILKCGKVKVNNKIDDVAYLQVIDTSKSQNEKVFIFNGWTFASDPSLTPFDHAIYDLQLLNCNSA